MPDIHFADGFEVSEPLALGLTPAQLVAAVAGLLAGYADLRSALPPPVAIGLAMVIAAATLLLAVGRHANRPLVDWAATAIRFLVRPQRGSLVAVGIGVPTAPVPTPPTPPTPPAPAPAVGAMESGVFKTGRRIPLVLLPEPVARPGEPGPTIGEGIAEGDLAVPPRGAERAHALACLELADAAPPAPAPVTDIARADSWPLFVGATRRVTFFSLSGGTGRTMLATEVAGLLAGRGKYRDPAAGGPRSLRVALLDLDLHGSSVGLRLGIPQPSLGDWLLGGAPASRLDDHLVSHHSGLRALLGSPRPMAAATPSLTATHVADMVKELERQETHFIVFDIGAGLSDINQWVVGAVHDIFIVLTPTAGGLQDAYRSTELLRRMGLRHKLRYVVNRSRGDLDLGEVMSDLGGHIDEEIADDPEVEAAENAHRLLGLDSSGAAASGLRRLSARIYPALSVATPGGDGLPARWRGSSSGWRRRGRGWRRRVG